MVCPVRESRPVGMRCRGGGNPRVTVASHYAQAKRETVAAQAISVLEVTNLGTWL